MKAEIVLGGVEVYPFSAWSLFSKVPVQVSDFSVRIKSVDGAALQPPLYFEDSNRLFEAADWHAARVTIEEFGRAVLRSDWETARDYRLMLEKQYMKEHDDIRYELVSRRFDPLERWSSGEIQLETVISELSKSRRSDG